MCREFTNYRKFDEYTCMVSFHFTKSLHINQKQTVYLFDLCPLSDASRSQRSSHFYDDPPYESDDSECNDTSDKSRRKFRYRKSRQDKSKQHRHSSSRGEVPREKSSISMNGSSRNNELSPDEFRAHMLARSHLNVNKRLLAHTTCSSPNTPVHHNLPHDISRLSSSCQPSPIYARNNFRNQGSKYSDYASSPVTPTRQRVGMLNRIKQLTVSLFKI